MSLFPKWIIKKEEINGKKSYSIYRRWLWQEKLYGRFDTKEEALTSLKYSTFGAPVKRHG